MSDIIKKFDQFLEAVKFKSGNGESKVHAHQCITCSAPLEKDNDYKCKYCGVEHSVEKGEEEAPRNDDFSRSVKSGNSKRRFLDEQ